MGHKTMSHKVINSAEIEASPELSQRLLLLGNTDTAEMRSIVEWANCLTASPGDHSASDHSVKNHSAEVRFAKTVSVAERFAGEGWFPDLVVVLQHWPDEWTARDVRRLFTLFPLARWVSACGVWCESDGRNRDVFPGALRVFARSAVLRLEREWAAIWRSDAERFSTDGSSILSGSSNFPDRLPLTAGREECFAYDAVACSDGLSFDGFSFDGDGKVIGVVSPDRVLRDYYCDLLRAVGAVPFPISTGMLDADQQVDQQVDQWEQFQQQDGAAILWDIDPFTTVTESQIMRCRNRCSDISMIALANFAHAETVAALQEQGVFAVVPKLAMHEQLLQTIGSAMKRSREQSVEKLNHEGTKRQGKKETQEMQGF